MFEVSKVNDISILHLYGDLALLEVELIEKTIQSFKKCNHYKILLDMAEVDYLHFQVAQKLVREANDLRLKEGDLKLAQSNEQTREILKFTGADQSLEDYSSVSEAILSFLKDARDPNLII